MKVLGTTLAAVALAATAWGQGGSASRPVVVAEYSHPGLNPSRWILTIHPGGSAHFTSYPGTGDPSSGDKQPSGGQQQMELPAINKDVTLSAEFARGVFQAAARHNWFHQKCESRMKVAFQGWKTLSYSGPEGQGSCVFNFSRNADLQRLANSLLAVAETILEGERLEMLLQHDRLGLDKEIDFFSHAVQQGEAQQLCSIRGILERLAGDDAVLERVRKQARALLANGEP